MLTRVFRLDLAARPNRNNRIPNNYDGAVVIDMARAIHGDDQPTRNDRVCLFCFRLPLNKDGAANEKSTR